MQSQHGTLVANTQLEINNLGTVISDTEQVEVLNRDGAAEIYFTTDGSDVTIGGPNTEVVAAAIGSVIVPVPTSTRPIIKLKAAAAVKYTVRVSWMNQ